MFDLKKSHFSLVLSKDVAAASVVTNEGCVLVRSLESGVEKVKESAGASGEVLVGFSITNNEDVTTEVVVETVTMSATGTPGAGLCQAQLSHTALVGTPATVELRVLGIGTAGVDGTQVATTGAVNAATKFHVDPATGLLTLDDDWASLEITVHYRYTLTALQSKQKFFERAVNSTAAAQLSQVGVGGGKGEIFTHQFDAAINYADASGVPVVLKSGPLGKITVGGSGATISGRVIKLPDADDQSLGVAFDLSV